MQKHALQGSERQPVSGAKLIGPADPAERLEVTLLLRRSETAKLQDRVERMSRGDYRLAPLTHEEFNSTHGASTADIEAVKAFAAAHQLAVVANDAGRRSVVLSGTVAGFSAAFGVQLHNYEHDYGNYRGREGAVQLPGELKDIVQAVLGLDNRPQAQAHFRRPGRTAVAAGATPEAAPVSYLPTKVASLYGFPGGTGAGQTIGIIELGGGTKAADLQAYFQTLGLHAPTLVTVSVDHGKNHATGSADGPDGEVMLDIEVAGSVAPGARLVAYFAPNTDAGFLDAITTAIHDTKNKPNIISISWGGPESSWTPQAMTAFDQAFQAAAALGITVCVAAGDNGSSDGVTDGANHVDFPASSPHVLACGGTSLQSNAQGIASETVWNDGANGGATGGGISGTFALPSYQTGLSAALTRGGATALTHRGVPDVAGDADPETGYKVRVDGSNTVIGGTSAVAPLWAGLIALLNASRGSAIGFINPILYANAGALHDITSGNNGAFAAAAHWDACTGLGSPNGAALAALFKAFKDDAFMGRGNFKIAGGKADSGTVKPDAFMGRGNDVLAGEGKVDDHAFMGRGNDVVADEGKIKDHAFMGRGN
jgi:kumamolisin